ncbi:hypothetical protein OAP48_00735 [bacterium]|nr:hypothetical protein [bacterium]
MKFTPNLIKHAPNAFGAHSLQGLRHAGIVLLVIMAPLVTGACAEIIPKLELRDDYMFKRFLQPSRAVSEVKRDEFGDPVLPKLKQQPSTN